MSTAALSTAALASGALTSGASAKAAPSPDVDGTRQRRRPRIAGTTTEPLPVRACSGAELGRHVQTRSAASRRSTAEIEPSALQLTRRGRMVLTAVSVLVFGAAIAVLGLRIAGVLDGQPQFDHTIQVEVGAGQTLWSIAQETSPDENPAVVVEQIADLNNLRNAADVIPGRTLEVPVR
ncbi:LysM peptidoglycan-binding domain-containing protein [Kribbella qitaiheensis]|uniref:LysM peptidoglycan-binding domain-containing protein n=1 Tax=Kribbella qitaiheensis TaxID=1544730 RepID=UPI00360A0E5C